MSLVAGRGWLLLGVTVLLLAPEVCFAQAVDIPVFPPPTPTLPRVTATLDQETSIEVVDAPLADVVEFLKDLHEINIQFDAKALAAVGIGTDTPVTRKLRGISLRSALNLMLKELDLTYVIRDEVLLITTPEEAGKMTELRVYDVSSLLPPAGSAEDLARALVKTMDSKQGAPPASGGGSETPAEGVLKQMRSTEKDKPGRSIAAYEQLLIVRDSARGHDEVLRVLRAIRATQRRKVEAEEAAGAERAK